MGHLFVAGRVVLDYLKRYPKTLAIRGAAMACFAGYFYIFPRAVPFAIAWAIVTFVSYLVVNIRQFFRFETRHIDRLTFAYYFFEIIWNLLSAPSEVDEI